MKVSHVGKQPTSLNGGLGSVLQIFHGDTNHARVFAKMSRNFKIQLTNFDKKEFVLGREKA